MSLALNKYTSRFIIHSLMNPWLQLLSSIVNGVDVNWNMQISLKHPVSVLSDIYSGIKFLYNMEILFIFTFRKTLCFAYQHFTCSSITPKGFNCWWLLFSLILTVTSLMTWGGWFSRHDFDLYFPKIKGIELFSLAHSALTHNIWRNMYLCSLPRVNFLNQAVLFPANILKKRQKKFLKIIRVNRIY